jgi:hypothetical protein
MSMDFEIFKVVHKLGENYKKKREHNSVKILDRATFSYLHVGAEK